MKKLSAFLLTIAVLLAMTACAVPDVPADSSGSLTDDAGNAQAEPAFTPAAADTETVFGTPEGVTDLYAFTVDVDGITIQAWAFAHAYLLCRLRNNNEFQEKHRHNIDLYYIFKLFWMFQE